MAEIVKGMFGIDPQGYQEQQLENQQVAAMQFARMTPAQQAQYGGFRGGQQIANLGANLMGVQDPELQAQQVASQLAPNYDMNDPVSLQKFQQALQTEAQKTGNGKLSEFASLVGNKIMQIKATGADIGLKQAQAVKALREPNPGIAALIGKSTPESVAAFQLSGNPADLVLADKGLTGTALEKVSSAEQNIENLSTGNAEIDSWIKKVDPAKPQVTFGPGSSLAAGVSNVAGKPTDNALAQAQLRRFVAREANAILVAAKGTQTEGDAQRAYDMIMSGLDKNSNEGVQGALEDLKTMKQNTVKGLSTYVDSMKTKGKGTSTSSSKPSANVQTSSQTVAAIRAANPGLENYSDAQILAAARKQKQTPQ